MGSVLSLFTYLASGETKTDEDGELTDQEQFHDAKEMKPESAVNELQTDAVESKLIFSAIHNPVTVNLSYETVRNIEQELSLYEKVSLVFLLYEQEDTALQFLVVEIENSVYNTTTNLILKWAQSKHTTASSWQNQLLEALCIIQNYAILKRLGYDKSELTVRYLPNNASTSLHVNLTRKALYRLCESMTLESVRRFLQCLQRDFESKNLEFQEYNENFMELQLLHCLSRKYITNNDLSNLISLLKRMGLDVQADILSGITPRNTVFSREVVQEAESSQKLVEEGNDPPTNTCKFDLKAEIQNVDAPKYVERCFDNSVIGDNSIVRIFPTENCYKIDAENVGICLIINQKEFYRDRDPELKYQLPLDHSLPDRKGTEFDKERLSDTFKTLGFKIKIVENRTHEQILTDIREMMEIFSFKDSCFFVCILSHGIEDAIYGTNSISVNITDIKNTLYDRHYKALLGKPKILILQACQGAPLQGVIRSMETYNVIDGLVPVNETENGLFNTADDEDDIPEKCDLLVCWSTVPGYASIRNEKSGSWYIQELCNCILDQCDTHHFLEILTSVIAVVSSKRWHRENQKVCMVPEIRGSLGKFLYLPKVIKGPNSIDSNNE